jgi:hypothetical protein
VVVERVACAPPQGARQVLAAQPKLQMFMHRAVGKPWAAQSAVLAHVLNVRNTSSPQKQSPSVVTEQRQFDPQTAETGGLQKQVEHAPVGAHGYAAKAGVRRLLNTGAVQAMAAPAPIRLSIRRLEIRLIGTSRSSIEPPSPRVKDPPAEQRLPATRTLRIVQQRYLFVAGGGKISTVGGSSPSMLRGVNERGAGRPPPSTPSWACDP